MISRKYAAKHISIFAVYRKYTIFGSPGRCFKVAFPNKEEAEKWVEKDGTAESGTYMIEEMPAIMKAWQPYRF